MQKTCLIEYIGYVYGSASWVDQSLRGCQGWKDKEMSTLWVQQIDCILKPTYVEEGRELLYM
jgi:hypothetical protein